MLPTTTTKKGGGYKKYNIIYVVFEKEWQCDQYPADGEVTFFNIKAYYDRKLVSPTWTVGLSLTERREGPCCRGPEVCICPFACYPPACGFNSQFARWPHGVTFLAQTAYVDDVCNNRAHVLNRCAQGRGCWRARKQCSLAHTHRRSRSCFLSLSLSLSLSIVLPAALPFRSRGIPAWSTPTFPSTSSNGLQPRGGPHSGVG